FVATPSLGAPIQPVHQPKDRGTPQHTNTSTPQHINTSTPSHRSTNLCVSTNPNDRGTHEHTNTLTHEHNKKAVPVRRLVFLLRHRCRTPIRIDIAVVRVVIRIRPMVLVESGRHPQIVFVPV